MRTFGVRFSAHFQGKTLCLLDYCPKREDLRCFFDAVVAADAPSGALKQYRMRHIRPASLSGIRDPYPMAFLELGSFPWNVRGSIKSSQEMDETERLSFCHFF